jgi:hypothetical protein
VAPRAVATSSAHAAIAARWKASADAARPPRDQSSSAAPARRITIWSSSIVTSTGPVARPVLGVDGVVGDGRVEPQAVALLAVVERALERAPFEPARRAPAAAARAARLGLASRRSPSRSVAVGVASLRRASASAAARLSCAASRSSSAAISASSSARRSISSSKSAGGGRLGACPSGHEVLLALERLDLLHGHLELVGDPRVGPPWRPNCGSGSGAGAVIVEP